jgi:hypothetical protein
MLVVCFYLVSIAFFYIWAAFILQGVCLCNLGESVWGPNTQRGQTAGGNVWKCEFLHSKGSHSQPLHPIDTILVPNCSWHWVLPEHVPCFMWVALRAEIDWIKRTWCMLTLMWWFPWGNGSNPHQKTTTQPFSLIFVAMIFFSNQNSTPIKISQIGAVGELVWTICVVKNGLHATAN